MKNNGMIVYKETFISKIKKIFVNFFGLKKQNVEKVVDNTETKEEVKKIEKDNIFLNNIKVSSNDINIEYKKKQFLKEIDGNLEALEMLSVDRLQKLERYYDSIIKQNNEKIKKLKAAV